MTTTTTTYNIQGKASFRSKISGGACSACVVARRFLLILLLSALLTPLSTLFSACGHDDLVVPEEYPEEKEPPYVELRIAVPLANPSSTRANPMGGEEGNGRERGLQNEDKVHDFNLFFFEDDGGMNGDPDTELKHFYYSFDNSSDNSEEIESVDDGNNDVDPYYGIKYITLKIRYWEDNIENCKKLKFLAVANFGKINNPGSLGKLRDFQLDNPNYKMQSWMKDDVFSRDASKYHHFMMSTAYEAETWYGSGIHSTGANAITDDVKGGYSGTTTLQRLYARLDLWYNNEKNAIPKGDNDKYIPELIYGVVDDKGNILKSGEGEKDFADVYITNVLPVNVMQRPSYLFKKVTNFGETWTDWSKTTLNNKEESGDASLFKWGGKESPFEGPFVGSNGDLPTNYVMERHTTAKVTLKDKNEKNGTPEDVLDNWYGNSACHSIVDAIQPANTNSETDGHFSAYYDITRTASGDDPNYYYGNDTKYPCNHISIIGYANENTHPIDCFHSDYLTGMAFRAVYVPDKIYKNYDSATKTLTEMTDTEKSGFNITDKKIYRYSPSKDRWAKEEAAIYFIDETALKAYEKDHLEDSAVVTEFNAAREPKNNLLGFICYYNLWLRHYNNEGDDPQATYPMEYATVRNNIYRVAVSFSGPGDPEPTMREPDTMKARIFVRKWNYKAESEIVF